MSESRGEHTRDERHQLRRRRGGRTRVPREGEVQLLGEELDALLAAAEERDGLRAAVEATRAQRDVFSEKARAAAEENARLRAEVERLTAKVDRVWKLVGRSKTERAISCLVLAWALGDDATAAGHGEPM